jgi:hypothetical protein
MTWSYEPRTLFRRINHRFHKTGYVLNKCSERSGFYDDFGEYYVWDWNKNQIFMKHVNLWDLALTLGVL